MSLSKRLYVLLLLTFSLLTTSAFGAEERLLMMRSTQSFPETMLALQKTLGEYGYTVSRVQRVDVGLTTSGFKTDKYRIVFFGKPEEIRQMSHDHPELIPYLPLKITLFAEEDETLLIALDPITLYEVVPNEDFRYRLMRWKNDILAIMDELRDE